MDKIKRFVNLRTHGILKEVEQREYPRTIHLNGRVYSRVIISSHYEEKHKDTMSDALILKLVGSLQGEDLAAENITQNGYAIFVLNDLVFETKTYRLVFTTHPKENYLGVINAFRRRTK